jgi:hypothetical protein
LIEEDIQEQVSDLKPLDKTVDDIDEEIEEEYGDDFEDDGDLDDDEYVPSIKPSPSPSPSPPPESRGGNRVTPIRPSSASRRPQSGKVQVATTPRTTNEIVQPVAALSDIQKAMERENERLRQKQQGSSAVRRPETEADAFKSRPKGFMADYQSNMAKINVGPTDAAQRAALQRLKDLRKMKIMAKRSVESVSLFQQCQQKDINLFLAGKSLKYCNLKSTSCQTGEDDQEIGIMTDEVGQEDKDAQFPTLTERPTTGELLPFIRRVFPLFEASLAEATRRDAGLGRIAAVASRDTEKLEVRKQARFGLPANFIQGCLGAEVTVSDMAICPQWYGADHAAVLFTWRETSKPVPGNSGGPFTGLARPLRSMVGLYPILASALENSEERISLQPVRCLYSFSRLSSLTVVNCRPHMIVAGTEMGSLAVWDLRAKTSKPADAFGMHEQVAGEVADAAAAAAAASADKDMAHLEGKSGESPWLASVFSTDVFSVSSAPGALDEDGEMWDRKGQVNADSMGVHCVEICCVRCSDVVGGDSLIFALDLMGVVSFWRVMELASVAHNSTKLALQGTCTMAEQTTDVLGGFLSASYICIHPQQQAQFIVCSTSGLRQANRKGSHSISDGPRSLELTHHSDPALPGEEGLQELISSTFGAEPCSAAFSPFLPGLLLAAYAEGDLALFDCSLCVPVTQWAGAVPKAPCRSVSVAWSTQRPCVFFVKAGDILDVWDLADRNYAAVVSMDLGGTHPPAVPSMFEDERATCELQVTPCGRPVVGHGGNAIVCSLPASLTLPLQEVPQHLARAETPIESLLVRGCEDAQNFPTLAKHCREVNAPMSCSLERMLLSTVVASTQPLQAWI